VKFQADFEYRTGIGTDLHRLVEGRRLILGGVHIPHELGLQAHSDGDVVIHAVIDAILGAMCMGDIGELFPDTDPHYENADSRSLLSFVRELMDSEKWEIVNLDIIIKAQQPKLSKYKPQIKRSVADVAGMNFANVNVKAKTNEGLDAVGNNEAIEAMAMVLLRRRLKRGL
jgi:2-C-methyl-D-erythritol 2,4-cyclodiphosphate synthase